MQIHIRGEGMELDDSLRSHAERRLTFALGRFAERIRWIRLIVSDQNGPKGGVDKLCKVEVRGAGWSVHVEDADSVAETVVTRVAERTGRSVARRVSRLREHRSQAPAPVRSVKRESTVVLSEGDPNPS